MKIPNGKWKIPLPASFRRLRLRHVIVIVVGDEQENGLWEGRSVFHGLNAW
jgi:hypothetical protein